MLIYLVKCSTLCITPLRLLSLKFEQVAQKKASSSTPSYVYINSEFYVICKSKYFTFKGYISIAFKTSNT